MTLQQLVTKLVNRGAYHPPVSTLTLENTNNITDDERSISRNVAKRKYGDPSHDKIFRLCL